ncbi:uncharacterized protein LOC129221938 [Uloborus diversus]|uniref:uncharacterized protein LOC129221938 n=1 Tax=Uloborus diversus TaxID=327109 RepID=UPI00240A1E62|nr:uncharacterized protein LOC129221938 [Uloborus diversus]
MDLRHILTECLAVSELTSDDNVKNIAIDVYDIVLKEIKRSEKNSNVCQSQSEERINEIKKKLKILMYHYGKSVKERDEFFEKFPDWREIRKAIITELREIAEWINYHRRNCNISKTVGASVSLIGGILCATSAALIPLTFGATTPLAITGASMVGAGGATSFGATVAETSLESKNMKLAQELIKEDKRILQDTLSW